MLKYLQSETIDVTCTKDYSFESNFQDDGTKALSTKIWFRKDPLGSHAGAFSHAYWWKASKAKWKRDYDTALEATINATFRNDDCTYDFDDDKTKTCNSCAKKEAILTRLFKKRMVDNGDVFSSHAAIFDNGTIMTEELTLNPCN